MYETMNLLKHAFFVGIKATFTPDVTRQPFVILSQNRD